MKFKFRLESILKHRKNLEEIARRDFTEAKIHSDGILNQINTLYDSNEEAREVSHKSSKDSRFVQMQQITQEYLEGNKIRIERKKVEFREAQAVTENKQEELVAAAKEAKILEKMKEKNKQDFKELQRKQERKETDELIVQRYGRENLK